jgi:DNA-binding transcriptional regulator YiaG
MAKKVKRSRLADDIFASLNEALKYARGKKADVIVHRVVPSHTDAREARHKLGLSQREFASLVGTAVGMCASGSSARAGRPALHAP